MWPLKQWRRDAKWAQRVLEHTVTVRVPPFTDLPMRLITATTPLWTANLQSASEVFPEAPYWAFAWPGTFGLARAIAADPSLVRGRRVLDFGAGCGLSSLVAAQHGAAQVVVNEIDRVSLEAVALNVELAEHRAAWEDVLFLDHADRIGRLTEIPLAEDAVPASPPDPTRPIADVVLAGDVLYDQYLLDHAVPWLEALAARGALVLCSDPGRHGVSERAKTRGWRRRADYLLPEEIMEATNGIRLVSVWEIPSR